LRCNPYICHNRFFCYILIGKCSIVDFIGKKIEYVVFKFVVLSYSLVGAFVVFCKLLEIELSLMFAGVVFVAAIFNLYL
jgi:hypothetical protein